MGAVEIYANQPFTTVSSGGTDAPGSGTVQTWTVASSSEFPAASSTATPPTQFHIVDTASGMTTEIMAVTNVSGTTWTVTRGAESTTPVTHASGFQVTQTVTQGALEQARAVEWVNAVTMFGADSGGVNDSTTAIQDALNAANAGQVVYLAAGTYRTSAPLAVPAGVTLMGASGYDPVAWGDTGTVIKPLATFSGVAVFTFSDVSSALTQGPSLMSLAIDGAALAVTADGIRATGPVNGTVLRDLFIGTVTGVGINCLIDSGASGNQYPYGWHCQHLKIHNSGAQGIILPYHTDGQWYDVHVIGAGSHGWSFPGPCQNSRFVSCRAEWTTVGYDGFHMSGSWSTGTGSGGMVFSACSTDRNGANGMGITATGTVPVLLSGCMFRRDGRNGGTGGGSYAGLNISGASIPVTVDGISVFPGVDDNGTGTNSPQYGLAVSGSSPVTVSSGYIQGASAATSLGSASGNLILSSTVIQASGTTASPSIAIPRVSLADVYRGPSGATAETMPRNNVTAACAALTSGTLYATAIALPAGTLVSNLTFATNTTAEAGGTDGWYVLMDDNMKVLAVTADQTAAAFFAASTVTTLAVTSPVMTTYNGLYYIGVCVSATTMPTFSGSPAVASGIAGAAPVYSGSSSAGQTTPPSVGTTMAALAANGSYQFYAYTS